MPGRLYSGMCDTLITAGNEAKTVEWKRNNIKNTASSTPPPLHFELLVTRMPDYNYTLSHTRFMKITFQDHRS